MRAREVPFSVSGIILRNGWCVAAARTTGLDFSFGRHPSLAPRHPLVKILLRRTPAAASASGKDGLRTF
jgi:hypothetical protein